MLVVLWFICPLFVIQVKAYGPGLQASGLSVGKPAEFTVDAKLGGMAPLKVQAQVWILSESVTHDFISKL